MTVRMPRRRELNEKNAASLPDEQGVYFLHDATGIVVYVGRSSSLRARVLDLARKRDIRASAFAAVALRSAAEAERVEQALVRRYEPIYNLRVA